MREQRLWSFRNSVLTALGLLQACGGQTDQRGFTSTLDETASVPTSESSASEEASSSALCGAMMVSEGRPDSCWERPRYAWDGARCRSLYCSCAGEDCDLLFALPMDCYEEFGSCDPRAKERAACISRYGTERNDPGVPPASECVMDGGTGCSEPSYLSESAAVCIAELEGLAPGIKPWGVTLLYNYGHRRVIWSVSSTTSERADGGSAGESLALDARTGFALASNSWAAIPGRPFLVDHTPRTAEAVQRADYAAPAGLRLDGIAAELRAALAAEWTRVGLLEHASVAAFARFALQLLGLGAPAELLQACQQAMEDELRHTRIAFGLASCYAEATLGPGPLKLDGAFDTPGEDLLAHVAMTTLLEGCIGETIASLDAREGAAAATDPRIRQVLSEIADDEQRHAELAWRFLDWALARRPSLASPLLARACAHRAERARHGKGGAATGLLEHGILPLDQKLAIEAQALEQVILPCLVALAGKHRQQRMQQPSPALL